MSISQTVFAQLPMYNMDDLTVFDCDGQLLDSDAGANENYAINENYTFIINSGGTITFTFSAFNTEPVFDSLSFYDGALPGGTFLGSYSGSALPSPVVANSGIMTIVWVSDIAATSLGWDGTWDTENIQPTAPELTTTIPACNSSTLTGTFDIPVACDSVYLSAFNLTYDGGTVVPINSVSAPGCTGGMSTNYSLNLGDSIDVSCDYILSYDIGIADNCDSVWWFTQIDTFFVNTCPPKITMSATSDTGCLGECVDIGALVEGCLTYTYNWSSGLPTTAGPHTVCANTDTTFYITIQDVEMLAPSATDSITITVLNPQVITPDTSLCQADSPFNLAGIPSGGYWSGTGITDSLTGTFDPEITNGGIFDIFYTLGTTCSDTVQVTVHPIDLGPDEGACPFSPPFYVYAPIPLHGVWSGNSITSSGLFTPGDTGVYNITYTDTINGCSLSKNVYVYNINNTPNTTDSVCQNELPFQLRLNPRGGVYQGPGIVDSLNGWFDPGTATIGLNMILFKLNGCSDTVYIFVNEISIGGNRSACPMQQPFFLTGNAPPGGYWSGIGIVNSTNGKYDPSIPSNLANDQVIYTSSAGCTDTMKIYIRQTNIYPDTIRYCEDEPQFELKWSTVQRIPWGGVWSGPGVVGNGTIWYFTATLAGVGVHTIYYTANSCTDSTKVVVYPTSIPAIDTSLCIISSPWALGTLPPDAQWIGPGITDQQSGVFDPSVAGVGNHQIFYTSPLGCGDTVNINLYDFIPANISGLDSVYCYTETPVPLNLVPSGGTISGPGAYINEFRIHEADSGFHTIFYEFGFGECYTSDTTTVYIHPSIQAEIETSDTIICPGLSSVLTVNASGGLLGALYSYTWDNGLFPINNISVSPSNTTTYNVGIWDGCSDTAYTSIDIDVHQTFGLSADFGALRCYGEPGITTVVPNPAGNYTYAWDISPQETSPSINTLAGLAYDVVVTDSLTECELDTTLFVPNHPVVRALFSVNPDLDCVPYDQKNVTLIDLSTNALTGGWQIDGQTFNYNFGVNPTYDFPNSGYHDVVLYVEGVGGCSDTIEYEICILEDNRLFIPDAFSPNFDGNNDVLYARASAYSTMDFRIFNRWGEKVFESHDTENGWDGRHRGQQAEQGVYVYAVSILFFDGTTIDKKGTVTLVR